MNRLKNITWHNLLPLLLLLLGGSCSSDEKELVLPLKISPEWLNVPDEGSAESITVSTSQSWRITNETAWVKCSPMSGEGEQEISVTIYPNKQQQERKATVQVWTETEKKELSIVQAGMEQTLQVSPMKKEIDPSGENFKLQVTDAGKEWSVTIASSAQSWLSIASKEEQSVTLTARLNNNGQKRSARLTIKSERGSKEVEVTQDLFVSTVADKKWSAVATKQSDGWYATNEAKEVAENVLLYQKECGGWYKNIEMHHLLTDAEKEAVKATKSEKACFDNGATTTELRFLAKMYRQVPDERYREAFVKGVDYIISAQYPNGGWPQYYPLRGGYSDYITFNDDLMVNLLQLLRDVHQGGEDFAAIVEKSTAERVQEAFEKGVDCILKCQIVDNGVKTFWCAQHHQTTLDPAVGRPHEFPSFSGMEGSNVFKFLMTIENPSAEVKEAVVAAAEWLEAHKIPDRKVVDVKDATGQTTDRQVVERTGEDMWGRFIQLGGEVAERVYDDLFRNVLGDRKGWITLDDGQRIIYVYRENAEASYDPSKAYQPIYGIYDSSRPFLLYRFLYIYEDGPTFTDKNGYEVPTSLDAANRRSYQYVGNWPQKALRELYPEWKAKHGM